MRDAFPAPRSGDRSRRRAADPVEALPADEIAEEPPSPAELAPFATIIKADLTGLADPEARTPEAAGNAVNAHEFLGAFSMLLASVGSGDAVAARTAATALQLELFGGPSAMAATNESGDEARARMLDDLLALIRFARLGDLNSADASAHLMARHLQSALLAPARAAASVEQISERRRTTRPPTREPASLVQGATAAYEMLMELDSNANAA